MSNAIKREDKERREDFGEHAGVKTRRGREEGRLCLDGVKV